MQGLQIYTLATSPCDSTNEDAPLSPRGSVLSWNGSLLSQRDSVTSSGGAEPPLRRSDRRHDSHMSIRSVASKYSVASVSSMRSNSTARARPSRASSKRKEQEPFSWLAVVEEDWFQYFVAAVISMNVFVLWAETDAPQLSRVWHLCDHVFLFVFLVELVLKVLHYSPRGYFFGDYRWWGFLDALVISLTILDLWIMALVEPQVASTELGPLRWMRLLRLLRVFKLFAQLKAFGVALQNMFRTIVWIFLVMFLFTLGCAIILTHLLGHGEVLGDRRSAWSAHADTLQSLHENFKDVPTSLFTLFQLTTTDDWDSIADPAIKLNPWWRLFFVFFITFASWSLLSVLTAVASDKMVEATMDRKEWEVREQERLAIEFVDFLEDAFIEADADGNNLLDKEEFNALVQEEFVHKRMRDLGIHLSMGDLHKTWEMLDVDDSETLTIEEFVTGLAALQEGLATKHIVNLDYSLRKASLRCEKRITDIHETMTEICRQNEDMLYRMQRQETTNEQHGLPMLLWQQWALKTPDFRKALCAHLPGGDAQGAY